MCLMVKVVVYSVDWDSHLKFLYLVFSHLAEANLTVTLAKCEFAQATVGKHVD